MSETEKPKPGAADIMAAIKAIDDRLARIENNMSALYGAHLDGVKVFDGIAATLADHGAKLDAIRNAPTGMAPRTSSAPRASSGGGACFPNYGRSKNQPVEGATMGDLEYYAAGCRRTLDDSNKTRWHEKERALLAAIEAEIARQSGGANPAQSAMHDPSDSWGAATQAAPPVDDDVGF